MLSALRFALAFLALLPLAQSALATQYAPLPGGPGRPIAAQPAPAAKAALAPEAPQTLTLTGVVLRLDGQPQPGAAVYLAGSPRELVVTDANGAFRLPAVPKGKSVTVLADYFGLGNTRVVVSSPSGQPLRLMLPQ